LRPSRKELRFIEHKKAADGQAYESRANSDRLSKPPRQQLVDPIDRVVGDATENIG
jgi:hypothetical protein